MQAEPEPNPPASKCLHFVSPEVSPAGARRVHRGQDESRGFPRVGPPLESAFAARKRTLAELGRGGEEKPRQKVPQLPLHSSQTRQGQELSPVPAETASPAAAAAAASTATASTTAPTKPKDDAGPAVGPGGLDQLTETALDPGPGVCSTNGALPAIFEPAAAIATTTTTATAAQSLSDGPVHVSKSLHPTPVWVPRPGTAAAAAAATAASTARVSTAASSNTKPAVC